jgi:hypothetical protein
VFWLGQPQPRITEALDVKKGDDIDFIYTDSKHKNPLLRVRAITDSDSNKENEGLLLFDREKYLELLLDSAETVLSPFGFDRKLLGNRKSRITDWRSELRKERECSVEAEVNRTPS